MKSKVTNRIAVLGILGLGAAMTFGHPAQAAPGEGGKAREGRAAGGQRGPGGPLGKILPELELSAEQKQKVAPILKEMAPKMKELREDTTTEPKVKREKMQALTTETSAKVREILTADQQKKFDELLEKAKAERGPRGGNREGRKGNKDA